MSGNRIHGGVRSPDFALRPPALLSRTTLCAFVRPLVAAIVAAVPLLSTGCVNVAANDWSTQASQSIADGLGSAISSLVEAALLSIVL